MKGLWLILLLVSPAFARPANCEIRDGKMFIGGKWTFLKIAKPLSDFSDPNVVDQFIRDLPMLKAKHFNVIEINCYWHHFDKFGESKNLPTGPLKKYINAIAEAGMYPCLSVETYGVGGGQIPEWFWKAHSDAIAVDSKGRKVKDDEYGNNSAVPSIFSPDYLLATRKFIRTLTAAIPHEKLLWFETTVEPQYMGNHALDFSPHALAAWAAWSKQPETSAKPDNPLWNQFRAEALANWINGDAAAFREIAGKDAYVAVDYLETAGKDMRNRNGDSLTFLRALTSPNIIQVNWHWRAADHKLNQLAYDNLRQIMKETGRRWAVTEHMTLNGTDYAPADVPELLRNTIRQGSGFGWEFVSASANSGAPFCLYESDWTAKGTMNIVDERWDDWMNEVRAAFKNDGR